MKLKTLLIDDEAAARSRLRKLLSAHPEIEVTGEAENGLEAVALIKIEQPSLIFLDVQMPGLSGFEVLRALPEIVPMPLVVFVTAYDEYALSAFEANAIGYLLKPINRAHLQTAVERARKLAENESESQNQRQKVASAVRQTAQCLEQIVARRRDRFVLVPTEDIFYCFIEDGLTKIKTAEATFYTDYQLSELEARLPETTFFRAHRSFLVNLRKVKEIAPFFKSSYLLIMNNAEKTQIQVSERQSKKLRQVLSL